MAVQTATETGETDDRVSTAAEEESLSQVTPSLDDRRVGRSTRRPPGAAETEDAGADELDADALEEIGTGIVDDAAGLLDTEPGRETLGTMIDGDTPEERDADGQLAIDGTIDAIEDDAVLEIEVAVVADDAPLVVETDAGTRLVTGLAPGQDSELVVTPDGERILLLDDDLSVEEAVVETSDRVAEALVDVAEENGVLVDPEALRKAVLERALAVAYDQLRVFSVPVLQARETVLRIAKAHDVVFDWEMWVRS